MTNNKIAVFGSAFNPPSLGHLSVLQRLTHFDKVLLVPSIAHAWGKNMAAYEERCRWTQAFINDIGLDNVELCDAEKAIYRDGEPVTTWALLAFLSKRYSESELTFVLGPDNFLNFAKFYKAKEITEKWSVLAAAETVPVRSTMIRAALTSGESIKNLTTPSVATLLTDYNFE
ncbi:nicotinate-nicotinamide nucleotide adenylyltransferase [Veronia nyctiphanis]|uniref:nicotinate-nicotinamide nucleotide adenylyltransferase n=1 Tax=Veronia nyctiphanis TaxID=1278244 RepID=UPI001F2E9D9A|nr:nicotinate-nicotinamide nucleotide adenylyltransferase [Veronia nyctiphanis]